MIRRAKTFEFLDRTWFWDPSVPPGFNRLDNTVRKVLSVSPTVPLLGNSSTRSTVCTARVGYPDSPQLR